MGKLTAVLTDRGHVAIDTNIVIYFFQKEQHPAYHELLLPVFRALEDGCFRGAASVLVLTELLSQPHKLGVEGAAEQYYILLKNFPHLRLLPVTEKVALRAAELRGRWRLKTPDALQGRCESFFDQ